MLPPSSVRQPASSGTRTSIQRVSRQPAVEEVLTCLGKAVGHDGRDSANFPPTHTDIP
jgi:hypothetical protein